MPNRLSLPALFISLILTLVCAYGLNHLRAYNARFNTEAIMFPDGTPARLVLPGDGGQGFGVTLPEGAPRPPLVILTHGIISDKEMMSMLANAMADHGIAVLTIDWGGHGENAQPFDRFGQDAQLRFIIDFMREKYDHVIDPDRIGLMGHSMGGAATMRYAQNHNDLDLHVLLAAGWMSEGPVEPWNTLFVYGEWDLPGVIESTPKSMARLTGMDEPKHDKTYGNFEDGTARRMVMVKGTDHIAVILAQDTAREIISWCREVWPIGEDTNVSDPRRPWIGVIFVGALLLTGSLVVLFKPWLPVLDPQPVGGLWPVRIAVVVGAHLLAVLLLTVGSPLGFIPMFGAPYVLAFYLLSGLFMLFYSTGTGGADWRLFWPDLWRTLGMATALGAVFYLIFGSAMDASWYHLTLPPHRSEFFLWSFVPLAVYFVGVDTLVKKGGLIQQFLMSWGAGLLMLVICVLSVSRQLMPFYVLLVLPVVAIFTLVLELPALAITRQTNNYYLSGLYRAVILSAVNAACWPTL